jgi:hypothetical protein
MRLQLVMENFRKFSHVETFRKISGNIPTMFAHRFLLAYFLLIIYFSGYFYRIIYDSGKFPEIF